MRGFAPSPRAMSATSHHAHQSELLTEHLRTFLPGIEPEALELLCSHLLCPVVPAERRVTANAGAAGELELHCPCHNGWFDLETGRPLAGPPRRPLARVHLEVRGTTVFATGIEEAAT